MQDPLAITANKIDAILKSRYRISSHEESDRILESVLHFFTDLKGKQIEPEQMLRQAGEILQKSFGYREVAIALKGKDSLFRYEVVIGYADGPEKELRSCAFTEEKIMMPDRKPAILIGRNIELTLAEASPNPETDMGYAFPKLINIPRKHDDDFTYGDYLSVFIRSPEGELLGYFELSGPKTGKLPSGSMMKWLELFASIVGIMLRQRSV